MAGSPQSDSGSNVVHTPKSPDGFMTGQSTTDKVGFYGTAPIAQPTAAAQAAVTDSSGGTASATSGIAALTSTFNSTILGNAIATLAAQTNAMRTVLVNLGLMKGS